MAQSHSPIPYKGFDVRIVSHSESSFGYEIRCRGQAIVCSQGTYVTPDAAFDAAQQFIDEVDRRMGLRPSDGQG